MIRWGAIAACLWAGAASAQVVPAATAYWGCGERPVAEVAMGTREHGPQDAPVGLDSNEAGVGDDAIVPKFVWFDRQAGGVAAFDAGLAVRLRILVAQEGPTPADLQVEAEQSIAADPQAGQMPHL